MRVLKCSCTISNENDEDNSWVEELDVYVKDSEGTPRVVDPNITNNAAKRELDDIIKEFNELEKDRESKHQTKARCRVLHSFIIISNRNYE